MNWERLMHAAAGGALTALLGAAGLTVANHAAPPTVPTEDCAAVVRNLARVHADTRASLDRFACKYRIAASEGVSRGWPKPTTRSAWDALCSGAEEESP